MLTQRAVMVVLQDVVSHNNHASFVPFRFLPFASAQQGGRIIEWLTSLQESLRANGADAAAAADLRELWIVPPGTRLSASAVFGRLRSL